MSSLTLLAPVLTPICVMLFAFPWVSTSGARGPFSQALTMGFAFGALAMLVLYLAFAVIQPEGWRPKQAADTAEKFTLWLAAGIVLAA